MWLIPHYVSVISKLTIINTECISKHYISLTMLSAMKSKDSILILCFDCVVSIFNQSFRKLSATLTKGLSISKPKYANFNGFKMLRSLNLRVGTNSIQSNIFKYFMMNYHK